MTQQIKLLVVNYDSKFFSALYLNKPNQKTKTRSFLINPILTGFLTDVNHWGGGALLGLNNVRLSKVVKTSPNAQNLVSNNYFGL